VISYPPSFVALLSLSLWACSLGCGESKKKPVAAAAAAPNGAFAASYFDALSAGCRDARRDFKSVIQAAEEAANRVKAGGDLYIASVRPDFVSEGMVRSGGLMLLKQYNSDPKLAHEPTHPKPATKLTPKDTVIFSWSNATPDRELAVARELHASRAFVIGIGPKPVKEGSDELLKNVGTFLESTLPLRAEVTQRFKGETYPLVSLQNLAILWAFTGEFASALTRQGYMPVMLQSVLVPGARERNLGLRGQRFHKTHTVPAIPAGRLGQAYLEKLGEIYNALRDGEVANIERAAQACTKVLKDGHKVHAFLISHFPMFQPGSPGDRPFMNAFEGFSGEVPPQDWLTKNLKQGDLFFFLGYYRRPVEGYQAARQAGAQIVEVISGMGKPETAEPTPDYIINPRWPFGDALVPVTNYDIRILPSSGVVQASIYWSVIGSMAGDEERIEAAIRSMKFVSVEPGTFQMGEETEDQNSAPVHRVTITRPFEMQATEVTQSLWESVMGRNLSEFKGAERPVDNVTWDDAQEFIGKLNARKMGYSYRLPTEAEWEYACRAGSKGSNAGKLDDMAWYLANSGKETHPVAQRKPNAWGLYDMNGNVCEWLQDHYAKYSPGPAKDPRGPSSGSSRVVRGCGWGAVAGICTSSFRDALSTVRRDGALGFRLVRVGS
jgi:formylglycine-generating enzyme required for sulfatase activity